MNGNSLSLKIEHVNEILKKYLPGNDDCGKICEAMSYSVLNGGKRLRAIMLLECFRMFSNDEKLESDIAEPFVAAIEFIHAYSLVHDDLPAMDNDVLRRGKPTTHVAFGHAMGLLAGDALLNYAFECIGKISENTEIMENSYSTRVLKAFRVLSVKAGYSGMIGGQVLDTTQEYTPGTYNFFIDPSIQLEFNDEEIERLRYTLRIYELKTSCLFEAALM